MIIETYASKTSGEHKTPCLFLSPFEVAFAEKKKITPQEYKRRDEIVRELAFKFKGRVGDTVFPTSKTDYEKYGAYLVQAVAYTYRDLEKEDWPDDDNPMILIVKPLKQQEKVFFCTTNYVTKHNPFLNV